MDDDALTFDSGIIIIHSPNLVLMYVYDWPSLVYCLIHRILLLVNVKLYSICFFTEMQFSSLSLQDLIQVRFFSLSQGYVTWSGVESEPAPSKTPAGVKATAKTGRT